MSPATIRGLRPPLTAIGYQKASTRTRLGASAVTMRLRGTIKTWNDERGFGFIRPETPGPDVFLHISALPSGTHRPTVGERVQYFLLPGDQGKPRAKGVTYVDRAIEPPAPKLPQSQTPKASANASFKPSVRSDLSPRTKRADARPSGRHWTLPRLLAMPAFAAYWWWVVQQFEFQPWLLFAYAGMSVLAFLVYANDKFAAEGKRWRTPEATLLGLALWCGWPGALIAQQVLRHKNKKATFVFAFWLVVIGNWVLFYYWHAKSWKLMLVR